jgi:hypothetical protein
LLLAYVDDLVVAGQSVNEVEEVMKGLEEQWTITRLGEISTILGLKVTRDRKARKVWLTQPAYIDHVLTRFPISNTHRARAAPITLTTIPTVETPAELTPYQEIVGCLQWIAGCTRPDISFAASYLARQLARPTDHYWNMALGVVAYLVQTRTVGIVLGGKEKPLEGWVDADWAGCKESRRSTTGWVFRLNGSPIVWSSRRQATVAASTVEAEYVAVSEAAREAMWLRGLLEELGSRQPPTRLWCDNQGSISLSKKPSTHQRTKHIDIKHHLIRELVERGVIELEYVATSLQDADILTKPLTGPRHAANVASLGLVRAREDRRDNGTRANAGHGAWEHREGNESGEARKPTRKGRTPARRTDQKPWGRVTRVGGDGGVEKRKG